jgi:hypothetical protein
MYIVTDWEKKQEGYFSTQLWRASDSRALKKENKKHKARGEKIYQEKHAIFLQNSGRWRMKKNLCFELMAEAYAITPALEAKVGLCRGCEKELFLWFSELCCPFVCLLF